MSVGIDNLKHIVVLMMENRSFDHMLGFLQSANYPINGLSGSESNLGANHNSVPVTNDAVFFGDLTPDPGHSHFDVMQQMFDGADPATTSEPPMSGFVKDYGRRAKDIGSSHNIMKCFSASKLPILSTLAQQFCVCDNWFSSVPGPTFPNRAFAHAATSIGRVDMSPLGYVGISKTVYELLADNGVGACIYYNDTTLAATFPNLMARMNTFFGDFQSFLDACTNDALPAYSFIEPRYNTLELENLFYSASDQHPDHDVHAGERLIQQVFQAIWNNQAVRNSTLLVIIYDEHGGLFDHAAPPKRVSNPDGKKWEGASGNPDPPFDFTWLGVRVPAILISPYIKPGSIDSTLYEHASVISTARKVFLQNWQATFLTQRDKEANTFDSCFNLNQPRTDTIQFPLGFLAVAPAVAPEQLVLKPLTEHQKGLVFMAHYLEEKNLPPDKRTGIDPHAVRTEGAAAKYVAQVMLLLHSRALDTSESQASSATTSEAGLPRARPSGATAASDSVSVTASPTPKVVSDRWSQEDALGYKAYARTLAAIITHEETVPPLTIGIKAPWGAGKTSVMKQLQYILDGDADLTEENKGAALNRSQVEADLTLRELVKKISKPIISPPSLTPKLSALGKEYGLSPRVTVWFNAWKYQTSDQIWAGLAHCIISQVTARMDTRSREVFWLRLHARRLSTEAIRRRVYELVLRYLSPFALLGLIVSLASVWIVWIIPAVPPLGKLVVPSLSVAFSACYLVWKRWQKLGEKVASALKDLVREPDYEGKMGFLYLVESDIRDVLGLVATNESPLVIFVDDLDRSVPRRVAEVVEAINLSLCGDYPSCIFVLGMEPAMVAAALEVANKDVIEKVGQLSLEKSQTPLGWRFLEKIVQLPVVVPPPTDSGVESYMSLLTGNQNVQTGFAAGPPDSRKVNEYKAKLADSKSVADVRGITERLIGEAAPEDRSAVAEASNQKYIEKFSDRDPAVREFVHSVAALIGNNPRQIKRYINVFRFYSALRYNLLTQSMASGSPAKLPSDKELAKFIALTIQWPQALDCFRIMRDSSEGPGGKSKSLLGVLEDKSRSFAGGHATVDSEWSDFLKTQGLPSDGWIASCEFRKFLAEDPSLWGVERCGLW